MEPKKRPIVRREFKVESETTLLPLLLETVKGKSRNAVKSMLTNRQVLVDGRAVTLHSTPLAPGQTITLLPPGNSAPPELFFPICYEDEHILAIEKPAGLLSVSSDKQKTRTAYALTLEALKVRDPKAQLFSVHRLDQETSGLLLMAKSRQVRDTMQENWDKLVLERGYVAVVDGGAKEPEGVVRSYLKETPTHLMYSTNDRRNGKLAITEYAAKKSNGTYTLMELNLKTGRKNQIRVHMKDLGCPVVGDKKYGGSKSPIGRLCLHATRLTFTHPVTGETIHLTSRKPRDFNRLFREEEA